MAKARPCAPAKDVGSGDSHAAETPRSTSQHCVRGAGFRDRPLRCRPNQAAPSSAAPMLRSRLLAAGPAARAASARRAAPPQRRALRSCGGGLILVLLGLPATFAGCEGWCWGHGSPWADKCGWSSNTCNSCAACSPFMLENRNRCMQIDGGHWWSGCHIYRLRRATCHGADTTQHFYVSSSLRNVAISSYYQSDNWADCDTCEIVLSNCGTSPIWRNMQISGSQVRGTDWLSDRCLGQAGESIHELMASSSGNCGVVRDPSYFQPPSPPPPRAARRRGSRRASTCTCRGGGSCACPSPRRRRARCGGACRRARRRRPAPRPPRSSRGRPSRAARRARATRRRGSSRSA